MVPNMPGNSSGRPPMLQKMTVYQPNYDYHEWQDRGITMLMFYRKAENCLRDFGSCNEYELDDRELQKVIWLD